MRLSGAERQRRHIAKLKALAAVGRQFLAQQSNEVQQQNELQAATNKEDERV
jgi:hypothetical protein